MTDTTDANRFAPPMAAVADTHDATLGFELGGRGLRFWAACIDGLCQGGVAFAISWFLFPASSSSPYLAWVRNMASEHQIRVALVGIAVYALLQGYLLQTRSQTIGKRLLGLRIVRSDGSPVTPGRVIGLRFAPTALYRVIPFVGVLLGLIDALMIFSASRRCLHDLIADTVVATAASTPPPRG